MIGPRRRGEVELLGGLGVEVCEEEGSQVNSTSARNCLE